MTNALDTERKKRKRELRDQQERKPPSKEFLLDHETKNIDEIKESLAEAESSKQENPVPLDLCWREFRLRSLEDVKYNPYERRPIQTIQFRSGPDYDFDGPEEKKKSSDDELVAFIEMFWEQQSEMFLSPITSKYPSTEACQLSTEDGKWKVDVQFLHEKYLILKMPRELFCENAKKDIPADAPPVFTYYGFIVATRASY
ncbi:hypothetical protein F53441_12138 [Fusarium austroafricanum]|uniref:Uncharacterized protein n=1 Tax=Fusarium austroafricanum TaxID=2364996 RepID=A0A8H4K0U6_9HYPO|nr:hypothetical protein F53441_12138 [Fusarium austroafricanum]